VNELAKSTPARYAPRPRKPEACATMRFRTLGKNSGISLWLVQARCEARSLSSDFFTASEEITGMRRLRSMRPFSPLVFLCLCMTVSAQDAEHVQKIVESLYPKNQRLKDLRMGEISRELLLQNGSQVADVGCGPGDISVILSRVVGPAGKVYCEDINDSRQFGLGQARANMKRQHVKNVAIVHGGPEDPKLPGALDAVLIVNAYHEMPKYPAMLQHIRESLKPGGRLVIVDNNPTRTGSRPREKQTNNHVISPDLVAPEIQAAGFRIVDRQNGFIDDPDSESWHWLIAAERP